jgi:hypothetical protein
MVRSSVFVYWVNSYNGTNFTARTVSIFYTQKNKLSNKKNCKA